MYQSIISLEKHGINTHVHCYIIHTCVHNERLFIPAFEMLVAILS